MTRRGLLAGSVTLAACHTARPSFAQQSPFRIGILTDMSSSFADLGGPGTGIAAQIAIDEVGGSVLNRKVELLIADHQQSASTGLAIAREWISQRDLRAFMDVMNSGIALGVETLAAQSERLAFFSAAATDRITEDSCTRFGFAWDTDTYAQTHAIAASMVAQGLDTWFVIAADYEFGHAMQAAMTEAVQGAGGRVVGATRHPLGTTDFSAFLLQAQASGAKVVAIASGGNDTVNTIKQAQEFGLSQRGQKVVALLPYLSDIRAVGLEAMQGLRFIDPWYWDMDDRSRGFATRFFERFKRMPTSVQASVYSSTLQYLKAVQAIGTDEPSKVREHLLSIPIEDAFSRNGKLLPNGRMIHDVYLVEVKSPSESKREWDYLKVLSTVPAAKAFRPLADSACKIR